MVTVNELLNRIDDYENQRISFREFEDWYEDNFYDVHEVPFLKDVAAAVEGAFAQYHYDLVGEDVFRQELANAVGPFVKSGP